MVKIEAFMYLQGNYNHNNQSFPFNSVVVVEEVQ